MSKAGEWAIRHAEFERRTEELRNEVHGQLGAEQPTFEIPRRSGLVVIATAECVQEEYGFDFYPECSLKTNVTRLKPHEAIALARWILDTFGEEATP